MGLGCVMVFVFVAQVDAPVGDELTGWTGCPWPCLQPSFTLEQAWWQYWNLKCSAEWQLLAEVGVMVTSVECPTLGVRGRCCSLSPALKDGTPPLGPHRLCRSLSMLGRAGIHPDGN
jgi:hypothetical protein